MPTYRVIRELGDADCPPGALVDPARATPPWNPARVARLVEQRFLEPLKPAGEATAQDEALAALRADNARLLAEVVALTAERDALKAASPVGSNAPPQSQPGQGASADAGEDLATMSGDALRALATAREIKGRSGMNREQLLAALTGQEGGSDA